MPARFKTAAAAFALAGACLAWPALAQPGPGGLDGPHGPGDTLLEQFDLIDADNNGSITPAEIEAHRLARFAESDGNGDGFLTAEEISAAQIARMTDRINARSAEMVQWMDTDGDGQLSADEMPDGPSPRRLARIDTDGNGAISRAEAEAAIEAHGKGMRKQRKGMQSDD